MKKYLVTGGAGFIGSHFIELLQEKKKDILIIDKNNFSLKKKDNYKNLNFHKINLLNFNKVNFLVKKYKPDVIVNFAAESHVDRSLSKPNFFLENNTSIVINLFNSIIFNKLKPRFVQISTDEVFGALTKKQKSFNLNSPYLPSNPYSISKAASDFYVNYFSKTFSINSVTTICSNNFGERQYPEKFIPLSILSLLSNEPIKLYGNGENIRDWIYVKDHCLGIYNAIKYGNNLEKYLIGSQNEYSNLEISKLIFSYLKNKSFTKLNKKNFIKFIKDRPSHDFRYSLDTRASNKLLKLKSNKSNFNNYLYNTIDYYINNYERYKKLMIKDKWFKRYE